MKGENKPTNKKSASKRKPAKKSNNPEGRPRKEIDFKELDLLCKVGCTGEEIAFTFNMSYDTLNRRVEEKTGMSFAEYFASKESIGKTSLRKKQFSVAMSGNVAMLKHLGENRLGQASVSRSSIEAEVKAELSSKIEAEVRAKVEQEIQVQGSMTVETKLDISGLEIDDLEKLLEIQSKIKVVAADVDQPAE